MNHAGPAGKFPFLDCADWLDENIPLLLVAFGRRSLEFAGSAFDAVFLHTFLSCAAVARAAGLVRRAPSRRAATPTP